MTEGDSEIEELMNGHLVYWLKSCLVDDTDLQDFSDLIDGPIINQVLLQIDSDQNKVNQIQESHGNHSVRLKNLYILLENLKRIYREDIGALILAFPDIVTLSKYSSEDKENAEKYACEARLLLVLVLGAAVQCSEKENFILKLKSLPIDIQLEIVENIKEVTECCNLVAAIESIEESVTRVTKIRDIYVSHCIELTKRFENELMRHGGSSSTSEQTSSMHLAVEIADWKSKLRKKDQELEEKNETLLECKEEIENSKAIISKLKQEVADFSSNARSAKMYRDELDAARLKVERCDRLENELGRARDKLRELEYLKGLSTDLRDENRLLLERSEELEEQVSRFRARSGTVIDLESQIARLKQTINDSVQEREELQEKIRSLVEENTQLQLRQLSTSKNEFGSEEMDTSTNSTGNSLRDQLATSAQGEVLRLNLENSRLRSELESSRDNFCIEKVSLETALENEKKKSVMKVEEMLSGERVHRQLQSTLENTVRELTQEKKQLGAQLQDSAINSQLLATELQESKQRIFELTDKISHLESLQRANEVLLDAEKTRLSAAQRDLTLLKTENVRLTESLSAKTNNLEAEISKRREFENQSTELRATLKVTKDNVIRSSEFEQQVKELTGKNEMLENSFKDLQTELYLEKVEKEKISSQFEAIVNNFKSITNLELIDKSCLLDKNMLIERLASNDELVKLLVEQNKNCNKSSTDVKLDSSNFQDRMDENKAQEVAQLQVQVSILESQISSLQSQQTAQQLANSQLVVEKEELCNQIETQNLRMQQISLDLTNLQKIHENLVSEYENIRSEKESARNELKSCQRELKIAGEEISLLKVANQDQELLRIDSKTLANLRAEHSKLKEDFRQLFSASERLKMESRSRDDELRRTRIELANLKLTARQLSSALENEKEVNTKLSARLNRTDTKLQLLSGVLNTMDEERKSLMSHVTSLLGQYHELLSNSMEDKEFFHNQEKIFLERLNGLSRQKENLEQKIMDHYRRLESCSTKKKGFGSSFVKKVRKAGSDIINKVPRARSRSRSDVTAETSITQQETNHSTDDSASERGGAAIDSDTDTSLSLGSAGTRRAIYYDNTQPNTSNETPTNLLVYNKVSAVLETTSSPQEENKEAATNEDKPESSIWYEYGCV